MVETIKFDVFVNGSSEIYLSMNVWSNNVVYHQSRHEYEAS